MSVSLAIGQTAVIFPHI